MAKEFYCPQPGTYEAYGSCFKRSDNAWVSDAKEREVVFKSEESKITVDDGFLESFYGTADTKAMNATISGIAFVFSLFLAVYFYKKDRSFWMWFFGSIAAWNLTSTIISAHGLHLKKNKE
jgi:hypothetical protein